MTRQQALDLEVRNRVARRVRVERMPHRVMTVATDRCFDPTASRARAAADKCQVATVEQPLADKVLQPAVSFFGACDDQQPRGVPVEAVHDAGTVRHVSPGDPAIEQRLYERPSRMARGGMDDHSRGLVHHEQVFVLVGNAEVARLRLKRHVLLLRDVHLQQLPALDPVAFRARAAVDPHYSGRQQTLGLGARGDFGQRGDKPVEPFAGSLGRNAEAYSQRRASPSRIAANRMPTPTTMKVSARLKAGQ